MFSNLKVHRFSLTNLVHRGKLDPRHVRLRPLVFDKEQLAQKIDLWQSCLRKDDLLEPPKALGHLRVNAIIQMLKKQL